MDTARTEDIVYEPIRRRSGIGTRLREGARDLWSDKARLRRIAMIWGVAGVIVVAGTLWLTGGRYVGTDDSYVHAAKLMAVRSNAMLPSSTDCPGLTPPSASHT